MFGLEGVTVYGPVLEWDVWRCQSEHKSSKNQLVWGGVCSPKSLHPWKNLVFDVDMVAQGPGCSWELIIVC